MLHTFVGDDDDEVREKVRAPFSAYLRTYFRQYETARADAEGITEADKDALMEAAFEKYFVASTLMGTQAKCARLIDALAAIGADESPVSSISGWTTTQCSTASRGSTS